MKNRIIKNIIFILLGCFLLSTTSFAKMYVVSGEYEYKDNTYTIDSNGNIKTKDSDNDNIDDTDDTDNTDEDNNLDNNEDDSIDNTDDNNDSNDNDSNYTKRDDVVVNDSFKLTDAKIVIPYSEIDFIAPESENFQLDLFGICMAGDIKYYAGNKNYLGNTSLLNEFYDWLDRAKYTTDELRLIIEKIKNVIGIISGTVQGKEYMQFDEDVISAVEARQVMVNAIKISKTLEVIFFCLGVIMMIYGFMLILSWIFDKSLLPLMTETGLLENGMLGLITFNHLRADDDCLDNHSVSFIKIAILGFACAGVGVLMISPSFRELLGEAIKGFSNIFGGSK